ncbi:MAG: fumarylacetoacetate hydrolase family protein [Gammaproteobacteria bacterium]|nr:fumarylacetoacetate hydrolase family protein [Gammaproteobacteria bacterium]
MKLATLSAPNHRDGILCIVTSDLKRAVYASPIVQTLQQALDQWERVEPLLKAEAEKLENNQLSRAFDLDLHALSSPLPRAYQWADCSVYVNHIELVRKSRGAAMPADIATNPLIYQGGSDGFLGPYDPIQLPCLDDGIDYEAEVAVITDDVPMGVSAADAINHIKLIVLVNDVSLRELAMKELVKGFGFFLAKPASSFSPIALTPDELGKAWHEGRVHLPIHSYVNEKLFGEPNAGVDMLFSFPELIAYAAKTRSLGAGTIIGSGTVSNRDRSKGCSCIIEKRTIEFLEQGKAVTPYLQYGDTVRIEMLDKEGHNLFGTIFQTVQPVGNAHDSV